MSGAARQPMDERRAALAAAVLLGAVVLVLGFGSGFWAEVTERTASGTPSTGRNLGTVVQRNGEVALGITPGTDPVATARRVAAHATTTTAAAHAGAHEGAHTTAAAGATTTTAATSPTTSGPPVVAASCSAGTVTPFWQHLRAAHLETSPGQQVADVLDVDQYVLAHTVLVEEMLAPIVEALVGTPDRPSAFWQHLRAAHLETSPGQQVSDALDLDQYVLTHTVLVEDILDPVVGTC